MKTKTIFTLTILAAVMLMAVWNDGFAQLKYETGQVSVISDFVDKATVKSLALTLDEARSIAVNSGFKMADRINLHVIKNPEIGKIILFNDGCRNIFLFYPDEFSFNSKILHNNTNTYGLCHEVGLMALNSVPLKTDDFSFFILEGWAQVFASVTNDIIYEKYGKNLWKDGLDYRKFGMKRLLGNHNDRTICCQIKAGWLELFGKIGFCNISQFMANLELIVKKTNDPKQAFAKAVSFHLQASDAQKWIDQYLEPFFDEGNDSINLYALHMQQYY